MAAKRKPEEEAVSYVRYAQVHPVPDGEEEGFIAPKRCHKEDAGADLGIPRYTAIPPGTTATVPLNLALAIPKGNVGLILPRLSLLAEGVKVEMGIVDPGYRGEITLLVRNQGPRTACLHAGARIAQLVVVPLSSFRYVLDADVLAERTDRTECP